MNVVYTDAALRDLEEILNFISAEYPTIYGSFERRLHTSLSRIKRWPESAQSVAEHPAVRVVPLVRYPYKIFYRVTDQSIEILHIHHSARLTP